PPGLQPGRLTRPVSTEREPRSRQDRELAALRIGAFSGDHAPIRPRTDRARRSLGSTRHPASQTVTTEASDAKLFPQGSSPKGSPERIDPLAERVLEGGDLGGEPAEHSNRSAMVLASRSRP